MFFYVVLVFFVSLSPAQFLSCTRLRKSGMGKRRIQEEKQFFSHMVHYFCKWSQGSEQICLGCEQLLEYAYDRLDRCPYGSRKPTCFRCTSSCFRADMRKRKEDVVRTTLAKMVFLHPVLLFKHIWYDIRFKA